MSNVITYNANGNGNVDVDVEKDVKFTLVLPFQLNQKVVEKADSLGLSKLSYIRMVLSQDVNK